VAGSHTQTVFGLALVRASRVPSADQATPAHSVGVAGEGPGWCCGRRCEAPPDPEMWGRLQRCQPIEIDALGVPGSRGRCLPAAAITVEVSASWDKRPATRSEVSRAPVAGSQTRICPSLLVVASQGTRPGSPPTPTSRGGPLIVRSRWTARCDHAEVTWWGMSRDGGHCGPVLGRVGAWR
jgi:hypothetical protein